MIVRLTSAARIHGITEGRAANMIESQPLEGGFHVDFYNQRAYLWKDGELLADAIL